MQHVYVKDNTSQAGQEGVLLWHAIDREVALLSASWWVTRCNWDVIGSGLEFIDEPMSLADWDRVFGDDVDICECAVTAPEDMRRVVSVVEEHLPDAA
jgi:hypothetical protein